MCTWLNLVMWRKLRARAHGKQARDGPLPESKAAPELDPPPFIDGEDKLREASPSPSIKSVEEHVGLFPIEPAAPLSTPGPAILEVIAVHGLGGGWQKTWTAENGSMWLKDFIPWQLDDAGLKARTWSYGYNSRTAFSAAVTDITDEAGMLLDRIQGERITHEDKKRHIVFVAHSLGGILVKKAMVLAQERSKLYGDLLSKVYGVIFLGTPHRGSDLAWWATFAAEILRTIQLGSGTNTAYVSALKRNSTEFANISQQWVERSEAVQIRTFYETERLAGVLVVDKDSARLGLPNEIAVGLADSNHRTICKFEQAKSQRYRPVLNALKLMAADIRELATKTENSAFVWDESHTSFVQLLGSSEYKADRARNPMREPGTCEWIPRHSQFEVWLTAKASTILWLSGDPGCGKSVASSFLVDFLKQSQPSSLTTYFFFKDDSSRQASAVSALCAVLHQIFTDNRSSHLVEHGMKTYRNNGSAMFSQFLCLWDTLASVLSDKRCGTVILILDAMDECKAEERQPLIEALAKLCRQNSSTGSAVHLKVVITSRPYAALQRAFKFFQTIHIRAEDSIDSIDEDVKTVINTRIDRFSKHMDLSGDVRLAALKEKLKAKADYTFLWVSLILDILDQSADCTFEELHEIIDNTNPSIESLYESILSKAKSPEKARRLLHIIVGAAEPLTADEVNAAWSVKVGQPVDLEKMQERSFPSAELGIRETCGLFVRFINGTVVLVHQTAKEFLVEKGHSPFQGRQAGSLKWQLHPAESSRLLAGICLTYLLSIKFHSNLCYNQLARAPYSSMETHSSGSGSSTRSSYSRSGERELPSVMPADHSTENSRLDHDVKPYSEFPVASDGATPQHQDRTRKLFKTTLGTLKSSDLGIDGLGELEEFMRTHCFVAHAAKYVLKYIDLSGPDAWEAEKLGKLALDMFADRDAYTSWYIISESTEVRVLVHPLIYAVNAGMTHLVKGLLESGHDPDTTDHAGRTALMIAVKRGRLLIADLLSEAGADCTRDDGHNTALHLAVQADNPAMVDLLLRHGAERMARSMTDAIPLHLARSAAVAKLLLKEQVTQQCIAVNWGLETPLHRASRGGHEDVQKEIIAAIHS
ncbi:hypothetical protein N8I77_000449 [Diaporthe amygdali]|uniref:NACHT domain-containing protein n=1 Tax=Phomopsis amygdali TaxID=1214568 RepID=A0AAD9SPL3_PHOAM|nr:hypothetical protein N8I77_000449 [Diaporthe amygdali]